MCLLNVNKLTVDTVGKQRRRALETSLLEHERSIVHDNVGTGQLLEDGNGATDPKDTRVLAISKHSPVVGDSNVVFKFDVILNFLKFLKDIGVLQVAFAMDTSQHTVSFLVTTLLNQPAWGAGQDKWSDGKDDSGSNLDKVRNTP